MSPESLVIYIVTFILSPEPLLLYFITFISSPESLYFILSPESLVLNIVIGEKLVLYLTFLQTLRARTFTEHQHPPRLSESFKKSVRNISVIVRSSSMTSGV